MASAWGKSWGAAWGNAWGLISPEPSPFADTHDGYFHKLWAKLAEREKQKSETIEELEEELAEIEQEIAKVNAMPVPYRPVVLQSITVPPFEAKARLIQALIENRQRVLNEIDEEESLLLLM